MARQIAFTISIALLGMAINSCDPPKDDLKREGRLTHQGVVLANTLHLKPIKFFSTNHPTEGVSYWAEGSFTYGPPEPRDPSIVTDGYGGACLLVQRDGSCQRPTDCAKLAEGEFRYCLDKKSINPGQPEVGTCWTRISPEDCYKAPPPPGRPLRVGEIYKVPIKKPLVAPWPVTVRLLGCLNPPSSSWRTVDGKVTSPCGTTVDETELHIEGNPITFTFP